MLRDTGYPVLAPSKVRASGGKFRKLPGLPVHSAILTVTVLRDIQKADPAFASVLIQGYTDNITQIEDPKVIIEQYKNAVALAKEAGFDGIELLSQG